MAAKIGTRKHAAAVQKHHDNYDVDSDDIRRIGSGAFRVAYLHIPSGVVYKVERNAKYAKQVGMGNKCEQRNSTRLAKRAWEHVYIPLVSVFTVEGKFIAAMEYVDGVMGMNYGDEHPGVAEWYQTPYRERIRDMHGGNYIIRASDKKMVPIDLAS